MGIFDKAKDMASDHSEQVDQGIEKGGDTVDDRTGGKYSEQIDKGQSAADKHLTQEQPPTNPQETIDNQGGRA